MLKGALLTMRLDIDRLPTEEEGLALLNTPPSDERLGAFWHGALPRGRRAAGPWNRPPVRRQAECRTTLPLYSQGADGQPGGKDLDADVGYALKR